MNDISEFRKISYPIHPLILNRWSPRAMTEETVEDHELMSLFEAARWAPSSYNNQPWKFLYAKKNSVHWPKFFNLLIDFNKIWVKNAAVLILIISQKKFSYNGKPSRTHNFDAGAAWQNMALQGASIGLVVHAMEGFDYKKAKDELKISDDYDIEAMVAIGRIADKNILPPDLQEREFPSSRKEIEMIIKEGEFSS